MGLVAGHRRAASELGSDDPESDVRERGDRSRSPADRHWCRPVQDHEGEGLVLNSATGNRILPISIVRVVSVSPSLASCPLLHDHVLFKKILFLEKFPLHTFRCWSFVYFSLDFMIL